MQPAPLAGTATDSTKEKLAKGGLDATRTPRGDCNVLCLEPANAINLRCNPHPSRGQQRKLISESSGVDSMQPAPLAGTATTKISGTLVFGEGCNPHPSRGQQLTNLMNFNKYKIDATRTPRGDSNVSNRSFMISYFSLMQPAPLTGTGVRQPPGRAAAGTFLPSYAGAVTRRPLLRASVHKDGLVVHPAHLLFFQSAPGRSGHLRKQDRINGNDRIVIHLISPPVWIPACHGCDVPFFFAVAPYSAP